MTEVNFTSMTLSQMVAFYNQHTDKPVKKFRDRITAEKRCVELIYKELKEPELETIEPSEPTGNERPVMKTSLKLDRTIRCVETRHEWPNAHRMWVENPDWMTSSQQDRLTARLYAAAKRGERDYVVVNGRTFELVNV
jgi:hypothetical protein